MLGCDAARTMSSDALEAINYAVRADGMRRAAIRDREAEAILRARVPRALHWTIDRAGRGRPRTLKLVLRLMRWPPTLADHN